MSPGSEGREKRKKGAESLSSFNPKSELEHGTALHYAYPGAIQGRRLQARARGLLGTQELSEELITSL